MVSLLLLLVSIISPLLASAEWAPFTPACSSYADPPPGGWKRWSQPSTWPNGVVPGINGNHGKATIPCNTGVILDVSVVLDQLIIQGSMKIVDNGPFFVTANFVIVNGKLTIGTVSNPYTGKVVFTLTNGGYHYTVGPEDLGTKGFLVIGGSVELNGMHNAPSWTKLAVTAPQGASTITVQGDVSQWPVGAKIAIASTDYMHSQAEERTITSISKGGSPSNPTTTIGLNYGLFYMHWGDPIDSGVPGTPLDESAEVGLLDRTIVIQGAKDLNPLIGGHFVVYQTQQLQQIIGLELTNMGQQGVVGKYPMHFHLCKDVSGSFVKQLSIHHTNQRCVVIHGSHNLLVDSNVAYYTAGHCYFLEDGFEHGNIFNNNLGIDTQKQNILINTPKTNATQSDYVPATFWVSNPNNTWTNNVAAGSADTGFWFQLNSTVLGPSANFPEAAGVFPKFVPLKLFANNVAHSNYRSGLRTFSPGMKPRQDGGQFSRTGPQNANPVTVVIQNFRSYKNGGNGVLFRKSDSIILQGGILADNRIGGVEIHDAQNITISGVIILGETANVGNPSQCDQPGNYFANCEPLVGCSLPVAPSKARSLSAGTSPMDSPMYGIMIDQMEFPSEGLTEQPYSQGAPYPVLITGVTFGKFDNRCKPSAAIGGDGYRQWQIYAGGHRSQKIKFLDQSPRAHFSPPNKGIQGEYNYKNSGPTSYFKIFRDMDGTMMGGSGGYYVANTPVILPTSPNACYTVDSNTLACQNACYRTVGIYASNYLSPQFVLTREKNGASLSFPGYVNTFPNLLAGEQYSVEMYPSPQWVQIGYADPLGCLETVSIDILVADGFHYKFAYVHRDICMSSNANGPECQVTGTPICGYGGQRSKLRVTIGGSTKAKIAINLNSGPYPTC